MAKQKADDTPQIEKTPQQLKAERFPATVKQVLIAIEAIEESTALLQKAATDYPKLSGALTPIVNKLRPLTKAQGMTQIITKRLNREHNG